LELWKAWITLAYFKIEFAEGFAILQGQKTSLDLRSLIASKDQGKSGKASNITKDFHNLNPDNSSISTLL